MASKFYYSDYLFDDYLGKSKTIKAASLWELDIKREEVLQRWEAERARKEKKELMEDAMLQAQLETEEAQELIQEYKSILLHTLKTDDKLSWQKQKKTKPFQEFSSKHAVVIHPDLQECKKLLGVEQEKFWHKLPVIKNSYEKAVKEAEKIYEEKLQQYNAYVENVNQEKTDYENKKKKYHEEQAAYNKEIEQWQQDFESGKAEAIEKYVRVVLENSMYPDGIEKDFDVQFNPDINTAIVVYKLPTPKDTPEVTEVKFVKSKNEFTYKTMKKTEFEKFYDDIIFQITLRTIHEVFESDYTKRIESVVFNGWVDYIDEATGNDASSCIISVHTSRDTFEKIQLDKVDYKKCVQSLKGLYAGKIINLSPVKPIMQISTEDKRFVESKEILAELNSNTNLASMHWEDFEHLVRELFEKMFQETGGEVKVTQASSDGGVDAIAFDPDPIRGGKFVIQAKRYNMTVSVSAVRDLYGTMLHEGATKGILVTTSSYGKDSYEFIKDKPVTLINGQELLHLFNKHGYSHLKIVLNR